MFRKGEKYATKMPLYGTVHVPVRVILAPMTVSGIARIFCLPRCDQFHILQSGVSCLYFIYFLFIFLKTCSSWVKCTMIYGVASPVALALWL